MTCSDDFLMSMKFDVYYSDESQDDFGIEEKTWTFDQTLVGYLENLGAIDKDTIKSGEFFEYSDKLIGRSRLDPRISSESNYYPITSIMITNVRDASTNTQFYIETAGDRVGNSTVYDVMAIEPYVNPWNEIEYYKIFAARSDRQVFTND